MQNKIYKKIIKHYGTELQLDKLEEELAELLLAVKHYRSGKITYEALIDEVVDADIMIEQSRMLFGIKDELYYKIKRYKKERTLRRISNEP